MDNFQKTLTQQVLKFRKDRNWQQFHDGRDIAMCLSVEANEVLELFLWKKENEVNVEKLADEIGDVVYSLLLLSSMYEIDITKAFLDKMAKNELKYPVEKFYNSNKKYNE
jgi:NTP pyrophosphatase (non-canonical NTP hydrolase)